MHWLAETCDSGTELIPTNGKTRWKFLKVCPGKNIELRNPYLTCPTETFETDYRLSLLSTAHTKKNIKYTLITPEMGICSIQTRIKIKS